MPGVCGAENKILTEKRDNVILVDDENTLKPDGGGSWTSLQMYKNHWIEHF